MSRLTTGQRIRKLRKERGLTQEELAERCRVHSFKIVQFWESDKCLPSVNNLLLLARALKVKVDDIVGGDD